ncbi:MAG: nitroreductase family protein [Desulfobacter postgatei]|uniref:nitroreductase family protein n=1 Tax=Desulfobacter postgatei TaxID=2293 RepID=UPI0023F51420|nr:nitroreductase family protein [Desulfobacter postgatei]MDD4274108.1 nitroreductase family protein [Desulfobacter postgatei]
MLLKLYLACETIDAGTCAIAAYDQEELDELLGLDGEEEFAIYLAPVGKVKKNHQNYV